jgi:GT2 family glycosyltransferase/SAM-dependent methyltransferase
MLTCRIIVLNYNGKTLLEEFMPSVLASAKASKYPCRVTVLDNCSADGSDLLVREKFPEADLLTSKANKVLCSYNDAVAGYKEDVMILLNNDIRTEAGFVDPLVKVFEDHEDAFFAATHGDCPIAKFRWGVLAAEIEYAGYERVIERPGFSFSAGIAAFHRGRFLELGGYDELYLPGRYEDVDLCYRGWRSGWKGYYVPASKKFHQGGASFEKAFTSSQTQSMVFRNGILFTLKNISDPVYLTRFLIGTLLRLVFSCLTGRWHMLRGFKEAVERAPSALSRRRLLKADHPLKDSQILKIVNGGLRPPLKVRIMRGFVDALGRHAWLRSLFFSLGFFTVRLLYPVEFLLLRELSDCGSVLDLGCGRHSMVPILPSAIHKVGVELYEPHLKEAQEKARHHRYVQADLRTVQFEDKSFDAVVMLDVLEHLTKKEGEELLEKMARWARKKVVIFTPNGYLPQHEYDTNPFMEHKSGWEVADLESRGFKVYGVRAFKSWMAPLFHHDDEKPHPAARFLDLFQLITYSWPEKAFQIFCVKKVKA